MIVAVLPMHVCCYFTHYLMITTATGNDRRSQTTAKNSAAVYTPRTVCTCCVHLFTLSSCLDPLIVISNS